MFGLLRKTKIQKNGGNNLTNWLNQNNLIIDQIYKILRTIGIFYLDVNTVKTEINDNVLVMYFVTPEKLDVKITLLDNKNILVEYEEEGENVKLEFDRFVRELSREEDAIDYSVKLKTDDLGVTTYSFEKTLKLEGVKANAEIITVCLKFKETPNDIMLLNHYLKTITKVDYGHIYATIISLLGYTSWCIGNLNIKIEIRRDYDDDRVIIPYAIELKNGIVIRYISSMADKGYFRYEDNKYYRNTSQTSEYMLNKKKHFGEVLAAFHRNGYTTDKQDKIIKSDWKSNHLKFE